MDDDVMAEAPQRMELDRATLIYDRVRGRPLLQLRGVVVLPVGATVELPDGGRATVVGVRLRAGAGDPAHVCLEVEVPADGGEAEAAEEAAVPEPIAAATVGLDLDPDAAKPLGTPLSSVPA